MHSQLTTAFPCMSVLSSKVSYSYNDERRESLAGALATVKCIPWFGLVFSIAMCVSIQSVLLRFEMVHHSQSRHRRSLPPAWHDTALRIS